MRPIDADLFESVGLGDVSEEFAEGARFILEKLDAAPTLEVVPVVHGRWTKMLGLDHCSNCHRVRPYDVEADTVLYWQCDYCPNCGAKMIPD